MIYTAHMSTNPAPTASAYDLRSTSPIGYYVRSFVGGASSFAVVDTERDEAGGEAGAGYARGLHTGTMVRFEQTGRVVSDGMVRCRITAARDLGGADVLVAFDGESWRGWMPAALAAR